MHVIYLAEGLLQMNTGLMATNQNETERLMEYSLKNLQKALDVAPFCPVTLLCYARCIKLKADFINDRTLQKKYLDASITALNRLSALWPQINVEEELNK